MNIIEINNLTKDYGSGRGVFDISLNVEEGQCYGFLGPNGAGKTTTIRHLMGFSKPQAGYSRICGLDTWRNAAKLQNTVGYLPGEIALPSGITGTKFLEMMSRMRDLKNNDYCNELLERFKLDPNIETKQMSLGVKRKLAIVTAFLHDPAVLILDEPTSGLDPIMQKNFIEYILEEKKRGKTIFLSSHIFREVDATCDRISIIKDGRIISEFAPGQLKKESDKIYRYTSGGIEHQVTVANGELDKLIAELAGKNLQDFREVPFTLENYFMHFYKEDKQFEGVK